MVSNFMISFIQYFFADPGGDFLSMMHSTSEKEKGTSGGDEFSFSMFAAGDTAGGETGDNQLLSK